MSDDESERLREVKRISVLFESGGVGDELLVDV